MIARILLVHPYEFRYSLFCCVERISFSHLAECQNTGLIQLNVHFLTVGQVHNDFVIVFELQ